MHRVDVQRFQVLAVDQVRESSNGLSFITFQRLKNCAMVHKVGPCAVILRGFVSDKVVSLGFEIARVSDVVVTLWDSPYRYGDCIAVRAVPPTGGEASGARSGSKVGGRVGGGGRDDNWSYMELRR